MKTSPSSPAHLSNINSVVTGSENSDVPKGMARVRGAVTGLVFTVLVAAIPSAAEAEACYETTTGTPYCYYPIPGPEYGCTPGYGMANRHGQIVCGRYAPIMTIPSVPPPAPTYYYTPPPQPGVSLDIILGAIFPPRTVVRRETVVVEERPVVIRQR